MYNLAPAFVCGLRSKVRFLTSLKDVCYHYLKPSTALCRRLVLNKLNMTSSRANRVPKECLTWH